MASKIKVTPHKEEMLENEGPDSPLLDLSDVAVKELIRGARFAGVVGGAGRAQRGTGSTSIPPRSKQHRTGQLRRTNSSLMTSSRRRCRRFFLSTISTDQW